MFSNHSNNSFGASLDYHAQGSQGTRHRTCISWKSIVIFHGCQGRRLTLCVFKQFSIVDITLCPLSCKHRSSCLPPTMTQMKAAKMRYVVQVVTPPCSDMNNVCSTGGRPRRASGWEYSTCTLFIISSRLCFSAVTVNDDGGPPRLSANTNPSDPNTDHTEDGLARILVIVIIH